MKNLLSYVNKDSLRTSPYPYVLVKNLLPQNLVDDLIREFPPIETITKGETPGSNKRFDYLAKDVRADDSISRTWREFIDANVSSDFYSDFLRLFGDEINRHFPSLKEQFGSLANIKQGVRFIDSHQNKDLLFDAHISINTPVTGLPNSVRTAHVDDPKKLFGGLFYLRHPDDNESKGGELVIYKYKSGEKRFWGQQIDEKYVEEVERVPYEANTLVLFLNTIDSVHGVTPRMPTSVPRTFVNLVAEFEKPLFDIVSLQENKLRRYFRYYKNKFPLFK
jgi:hypothetical protein